MNYQKKYIVLVLMSALVLTLIPADCLQAAKKVSLSEKKLTVTVGKSKTLKLKNNTKKVKWTVASGKKYVKLKSKKKNSVKIVGIKKGIAKVQVTIGRKKYVCKVTVKKLPSEIPAGYSKKDVTALGKIIDQQKKKNKKIGLEPITDGPMYTWEKGRLTGINWGEIQLVLKGELDFSGLTALRKLNIKVSEVTKLDVSKNTALQVLDCADGKLKNLDVSKNTALKILFCDKNQIKNLDVSKNTALENLGCSDNRLTSLDVSKNIALEDLNCSYNQLTSLDVSRNVALKGYLNCSGNQLKNLDVSKNIALKRLLCNANQLTSLDVSKNTALEYLTCSYNQISRLDLSKSVNLRELVCYYNKITVLDARNTTDLRVQCDKGVEVKPGKGKWKLFQGGPVIK